MATLPFTMPLDAPPPPLEPVTLEGRLVRLEPLSVAHLPALIEIGQGPRETFALTNVPADEAAMRRWLEVALAAQARFVALPFATIDRRDGTVIGTTRFANIETFVWPDGAPRRPSHSPDAVEIGWTWLSPRAQRTGINTEAKLLMLTHAFEWLRVTRVNLKTDARNLRSRAAIERLGARQDGVLRAHSPAWDGRGLRDTALYSILAGEWPAAKTALQERLAR